MFSTVILGIWTQYYTTKPKTLARIFFDSFIIILEIMIRYQIILTVIAILYFSIFFPMPPNKNKRNRQQSERERYEIRKKQKKVQKELNRMEAIRKKKELSRSKEETSRIMKE